VAGYYINLQYAEIAVGK